MTASLALNKGNDDPADRLGFGQRGLEGLPIALRTCMRIRLWLLLVALAVQIILPSHLNPKSY